MYPKILSLYGPFELNSYNTAIMIGIGLFMYLANKHPLRKAYLTTHSFINLVIETALAALLGARIVHIVSSLSQYTTLTAMLSIWDGGLSALGALIGSIGYVLWYCHTMGLPFFALADIGALYAPLVQAIGRLGCFLVGCCHGAPASSSFSITYTHPASLAPLGIALHPAQLYSALLFVLLYAALHVLQKYTKVTGTLTVWYLLGMSLERFVIDFLRGDRIPTGTVLSFHQWVALGIFCGALVALVGMQQRVTRESI